MTTSAPRVGEMWVVSFGHSRGAPVTQIVKVTGYYNKSPRYEVFECDLVTPPQGCPIAYSHYPNPRALIQLIAGRYFIRQLSPLEELAFSS